MDKEPSYKDDDLLNFGKYRNQKLEDVPASYLHWWYHETDKRDIRLKNYIENNVSALRAENDDLLWIIV